MIGPVGTPGIGQHQSVRLRPSGVEVPPEPRRTPPVAAELSAQTPPVDTARVSALKAAIAEGRYTVDAARIADAMIAADMPPQDR